MESYIRAGMWKTNITPPVGIATVGSFSDIRAEEILDELYSNAIVLDDGSKETAIVSVDVCYIPNEIYGDISGRIESSCGIGKSNIIIAATHTHTGPMIGELLNGVGEVWHEYVEIFKKSVVTSVIMARKKKQPVRVGAGKGINDKYSFNRRLKKPDGSIVMNWNSRDLLQDCVATGPVDPEVCFVRFDDLQGSPVAFIVNYANHNNAIGGSPAISADWSGCMAKTLAKVYGNRLVTLFLPGACGDVNWIDFQNSGQTRGYKLVEEIGASLAGTIMENTADIEYQDAGSVEAVNIKIRIPDRPFADYDTYEDLTFGKNEGAKKVFACYRYERQLAEGKALPVNEFDIHALKLGNNIAIVTNPGELFTGFGLMLKEKSHFKYTMVSELSNGYAGYIGTREAFKDGGYEVRKTNRSSHLEIEAGYKMVEAGIGLLNKLRRG